MQYPLRIAHRTDTGRERKENQDAVSYICDERFGHHLLIVADGMGGAACGQVASRLAVQTIRQCFFTQTQSELSNTDRLNLAIIEANRMIIHRASRDRRCRGMGSTCAVLLLDGTHAHMAHAGDSRIYLIREGLIKQLTRDHSRTQRMLDDGLISEEEALDHPDRNWLDRALGLREDIKPDVRSDPIVTQERDIFLLCTDGLTGLVRDEEIFRVARKARVEESCEALIALANERGGEDNITVAIARFGPE
jgi:serine/threonine protein phosphatase PrpC